MRQVEGSASAEEIVKKRKKLRTSIDNAQQGDNKDVKEESKGAEALLEWTVADEGMPTSTAQVAHIQAKEVWKEGDVGQRLPLLALHDTQQQHTNEFTDAAVLRTA